MKIAVIGTGYVGLVTGACLAKAGHDVTCVDQDRAKFAAIQDAKAPFFEPGLDDLLAEVVASGRLTGCPDIRTALDAADASFIAVGTPSKGGRIVLDQVIGAAREIGAAIPHTGRHHTVVLKSTCVPGTTEDHLRPAIEAASGLVAGRDFGLCMNPEFLREGNAVEDTVDADRIVMGVLDDASRRTMEAIYAPFDCPKIVTTPRNAEMIKYASNGLLATLISFSNEISQMCETMPGLDEATVMDGLHLDRRLSPVLDGNRVRPGILTYLRAGIGYGGSCFPKDTLALQSFARDLGMEPLVLNSVIETNDRRAAQILDLIERGEGSLEGKTVAVLGLAFKPGTDDVRESPGIRIANACVQRGAAVKAWDPVASGNAGALLNDAVNLFTGAEEALTAADIAVIATAWPEIREIDWARAASVMASPVIFDGRSILRGVSLPKEFRYGTIGRLSGRADDAGQVR